MKNALCLIHVPSLATDFRPVDVNAKIREFQAAIATALFEKGGFAYKEPWYQKLKQELLDCGLAKKQISLYEGAVITTYLGIDLIGPKKKAS